MQTTLAETQVLYPAQVKLDFGVQLGGNIIDCAFSFSFSPEHNRLMAAVKARILSSKSRLVWQVATTSASKIAGPGARMRDIGRVVSEVSRRSGSKTHTYLR
jgi:methionyl aminopeptidase